MQHYGPVVGRHGLNHHGLHNLKSVYWNLSVPGLYEHAIKRGEARLSEGGALVALTGEYTGRSPKDRFIVKDAATEKDVWWGEVNKGFEPAAFDKLQEKVTAYFQGRDAFVQDLWAGADKGNRLNVRVVSENAWHVMFAHNMFIVPDAAARADFTPDFTVLHAPNLKADPAVDGTRSEAFIIVNFTKKMVIIGGTQYAGEIKKSIFSILNFLLPAKGVFPMHCSANMGPEGDTAVFFGLSGTGKTTLSADASRTLIGDDEHGWTDSGVFNFEGGCYAKAIRLDPKAEPEIYATTKRFGTILENVVIDPETRVPDFDDATLAENTRASYPLDFIPNASDTGIGGIPNNIIMLTADAYGVLPPIAKLTPEQAMYHFLSGYTARVAGTERGVTEPQATFSTCFGAPFMPRHPGVYAKLLGEKMKASGAHCWLVNTGWSGGAYGTGSRMKIAHTRALVRAALDGTLAKGKFVTEPVFGLEVPESCEGVPAEVLQPRNAWSDKDAYDRTAAEVAKRFEANFKTFESGVDEAVLKAAIKPKIKEAA